ncbi:hypothetical protein, partial [Hungatella hathewayi]|uniref:hypothetical protein n=1 Tax=Hungatella hathewayi TaxID=154046 RepID=UPI0026DD263E
LLFFVPPLLDNGGFERLANARPTAKVNQTLASKLAWLYVFDRHRVWITPSVCKFLNLSLYNLKFNSVKQNKLHIPN